MISLRTFIIEPVDSMRESLEIFVQGLGHEVVSCTDPELCPSYYSNLCECPQQHACADVLIVGQNLPLVSGINFIEKRIRGGCKGAVQNMALICSPWSATDRQRARDLGCRWFETPLDLKELGDWLIQVAQNTPSERKLADLCAILPWK